MPAVLVGSLFSSTAPDRYVRPVITFVIFASGLKYVGLGHEALGWVLCATLLGVGGLWLAVKRPWESLGASAELAAEQGPDVVLEELAIAESPARPQDN